MTDSPFLRITSEHWIASNAEAFAVFDRYPVSNGHSLVITKRVVATWFDATPSEQSAVMKLVNAVKRFLDESLRPKPDGYNVGFNAGDAAGQTVPHLHVHVIPRYTGDVQDPRGGVRFVIPDKANYLKSPSEGAPTGVQSPGPHLSTGHPASPLWEHLSWRIAGARKVDVLASFVQSSGLDVIEERLFDALRNDAQVRILVSDYLYISDARALRRLLGWCDLTLEEFGDNRLQARLIEVAKMPSAPASFHPKAWHIVEGDREFISVGSSNLSRPALQTGVEWNLLSSGSHHRQAHAQVATEFESLWRSGTLLTPSLVAQYDLNATKYRQSNFVPASIETEEIPTPRAWQIEALAALKRLRLAGHTRALVAVATGMGKTWLAAFDACQLGDEIRRRPRVLIIAHRAHILAQAEASLSLMLDHRFTAGTTAWYIGDSSELAGELVVASVQKLSRPEGLERLAKEHFDYVIMDEVHHAHAPSYRRFSTTTSPTTRPSATGSPKRHSSPFTTSASKTPSTSDRSRGETDASTSRSWNNASSAASGWIDWRPLCKNIRPVPR
jgi:diadenosine tetraphosphate (Ap4A) HIT family hydrolase/HKD family nuclease